MSETRARSQEVGDGHRSDDALTPPFRTGLARYRPPVITGRTLSWSVIVWAWSARCAATLLVVFIATSWLGDILATRIITGLLLAATAIMVIAPVVGAVADDSRAPGAVVIPTRDFLALLAGRRSPEA